MVKVLLLGLFLSLPTWAFAQNVRVDTTKPIHLSQFSVELTAISGVSIIPLNSVQGLFVQNPTGVVTQAQLQQAVDAHVAVFPPPVPPEPKVPMLSESMSSRELRQVTALIKSSS